MTLIVSIIVGFAIGCLINYAITFKTGQARNFAICIAGAVLGGALIPALLSMSSFWTALIGSVIGIVVVLYLWLRFAPAKA